jgi:hypothetical protein
MGNKRIIIHTYTHTHTYTREEGDGEIIGFAVFQREREATTVAQPVHLSESKTSFYDCSLTA